MKIQRAGQGRCSRGCPAVGRIYYCRWLRFRPWKTRVNTVDITSYTCPTASSSPLSQTLFSPPRLHLAADTPGPYVPSQKPGSRLRRLFSAPRASGAVLGRVPQLLRLGWSFRCECSVLRPSRVLRGRWPTPFPTGLSAPIAFGALPEAHSWGSACMPGAHRRSRWRCPPACRTPGAARVLFPAALLAPRDLDVQKRWLFPELAVHASSPPAPPTAPAPPPAPPPHSPTPGTGCHSTGLSSRTWRSRFPGSVSGAPGSSVLPATPGFSQDQAGKRCVDLCLTQSSGLI